jgi:hypothetical protein
MQSDQSPSLFAHEPEILPLNRITVETALSRYPVHRLAKQGTINIDIREKGDDGELLVKWAVDHEGGPQSYKLETLVINRRFDELGRPLPKTIRLGGYREICRDLGKTEGGRDIEQVKKAFHQSAGIYIKAKIHYKLVDGIKRTLEAGFTRYSVVLVDEELPDGTTADAVYLILNDIYMQVINGAQTRPLDYDYLKELPPAAQRFYELVSYQIYAALKHTRPRARLPYSEFCTYAPLTRHFEWLRVRTQMNKIHAPHKNSGYIKKIEFEQTTDAQGQPDWLM